MTEDAYNYLRTGKKPKIDDSIDKNMNRNEEMNNDTLIDNIQFQTNSIDNDSLPITIINNIEYDTEIVKSYVRRINKKQYIMK